MAKLVEKTYGDALFELSVELELTDVLYEEATALITIFIENEEMIKLLNHPKITKDEKISFVSKTFKGRVSEQMEAFLTMLVKKDRQGKIIDCLEYFIARVKEYKKIGIAYVTSAVPLDNGQKDRVIEKLISTTHYESFEMHYDVDKSIIGGMVIRIGDRVVDSSIVTKINNLSKELYSIQLN